MDSWNYRIIEDDDTFYICEVYYDADGNPEAYSEGHSHPMGSTKDALFLDIDLMLRAMTKSVLHAVDFPAGG